MQNMIVFLKKYKYNILIIIMMILLFFQMQNVFFSGDDFEVLNPVHNSQDFFSKLKFSFNKMNYFWYEWSGRIVGHFTVSLVLSLSINVFRFLNPIMILLMLYLCLKIFSLFRIIDLKKWLCVFLFIFLGMNIHLSREILYWGYSGILYIWGFNLTLIVIYFVCKSYKNKSALNWKLMLLLILLTFIQGFILEQIIIILFLFLLLVIINSKLKKQNFNQYLILFITCFLGLAISGLAPGNKVHNLYFINEFKYFSFFERFWCKLHLFFKFIFQNKLYGTYFLIFSILVSRKYFKIEKNKVKKIILGLFWYSYFILFLINLIFPSINILGDIGDLTMYYYLDSMQSTTNIQFTIIRDIYFSIYLINISYMFFKVLPKKQKFLFFAYAISLISLMVPIVFVRFAGARYGLYFLLALILIIFNFYLDDKETLIDFKSGILLILIFNLNIYLKTIIFIIYIILFLVARKKVNGLKYILIYFLLIFYSYCFVNFGLVIYNYSLNKKIHIYNDLVLRDDKVQNKILYEIPYGRSLYSWHTIFLDFNGYNMYYGHYMNEWYEDYYNIDASDVIVLDQTEKNIE